MSSDPTTTALTKKAPSRASALKQAAVDSFRRLDTTQDINVYDMTELEQEHYDRLFECIQAHKLRDHSNQQLFRVKRFVTKRKKDLDNNGRICIACTLPECFHKIFLVESDDTNEGWQLEKSRVMQELLAHENKHYVTFAKLFLWLLEALMVMIVNYYDV